MDLKENVVNCMALCQDTVHCRKLRTLSISELSTSGGHSVRLQATLPSHPCIIFESHVFTNITCNNVDN